MPTAKQQLDEFYLPLLVMQERGKRVFRMFLTLLGRSYVFMYNDTLPEREMNLWAFWAENAFLPMNDQMVDLILKAQERNLIVGQIPDSFHEFIHYQQRFAAAHERWVRDGGQYQHPGNFPDGFEQDVLDKIGQLALETGWLPKMLT